MRRSDTHRKSLFHGTRNPLAQGAELPAGTAVTAELDAAIWAAELAEGDGEPRVWELAADELGRFEQVEDLPPAPHPQMTLRTTTPMAVEREVVEWLHYHGTRADLRPGDLVEPGHLANHGAPDRRANFVYFTRTLDASIWGAELAAGDSPPRIYVVEPTGEFEDDPNLTDMRFRGNPTKSFRSREPLRVVRELDGWTGHPAERIRAMREGLARLAEQGVERDG